MLPDFFLLDKFGSIFQDFPFVYALELSVEFVGVDIKHACQPKR